MANGSNGGGLTICRNKHWRYISAYNGIWVSMPIDQLEEVAHEIWHEPSPHTIHPGTIFDVLKIRKLVDQAANDAVRASTSTTSNRSKRGQPQLAGDAGGPMSKQRVMKVRQQACRSMSSALETDEIAASVASMAATSTLEDVAQHVLKKEPQDVHAKYVHFFHEKIPSRGLSEYTPLDPLEDLLRRLPFEQQLAPIRTRAGVQAYKGEYLSASTDYSTALRMLADRQAMHRRKDQQADMSPPPCAPRTNRTPCINEDDRPSGLELQLLFGRASAYLSLAQEGIRDALNGLQDYLSREQRGETHPAEGSAHQYRLDARKQVKTYAKRAQKDLLSFLAQIEYSPGHSVGTPARSSQSSPSSIGSQPQQWNGQQSPGNAVAQRAANYPELPPITIYPVSTLFAEKFPSEPPITFNPSAGQVTAWSRQIGPSERDALSGAEIITFHPLLIEVLHLLLIAHALAQTSPKELRRHALMAARLCALADGHHIFQVGRSPAKADWTEVLQVANDWLGLGVTWTQLLNPRRHVESPQRQVSNTPAIQNGAAPADPHNAMMETLSDDRVVDETTFQQTLQANRTREQALIAMHEEALISTSATLDKLVQGSDEKAHLIARWIRESPVSLGPSKKKRPAQKRQPPSVEAIPSLSNSISSLVVGGSADNVLVL